jgi:uncharacterized protein (TIGR03437 family)
MLERVPAIAPLGVRNAAFTARAGAVAPGSLISIFGANLATGVETGPSNPLAQTLQGVTARVGDAFLPLILVSPEQINAQLISSLEPGSYTLVVRVGGRAEVSIPIEVARNAPGLFNTLVEDIPLGAFAHANGQPVTPDAPARAGEVVSLFATGLGPYNQTPADGFSVEESPLYGVKDPVEVLVDGEKLPPIYAGRASGAGIDVVRLNVPAVKTGSRWLPVQVTVNSIASNVVFLPIAAAE